ncbi:tripartite tricarboxylate transporter substrate binding protein [Ideonella sp. A 288]|uniref:Bug family tripartite tricarboxylate transporter substrate binding protein n=1 Tax=Ideonella sp. A 288 TaxID=1962181 RepID=UPI001303D7E5|nr:tripartite tricarboxylate transporter substrate binding protein [Ideonella sp. A 288]
MPTTFQPTRRYAIQTCAALAAGCVLPTARAQADFPRGPIKIIIPLPAGGAADVGVRAMAIELEKSLKHSVVIENKPSGLYQIGLQALLQAPADGHTLMHLNSGMVAVQVVQKRFDLNRQLIPLTVSGETPMVLMVGPASPHKALKDLVAFGRANPGKLTYATPGPGSIEHLKVAEIEKVAGFTGLNVAYKGGPDMVKAVIGGEVDFAIAPAIFAAQFAPKGQVKVLAAVDATRLKEFPEVPTIVEAGVNVSPLRLWGGFAVLAGTPAPIVQRLHRELAAAATAPSVVERLTPFGMLIQASKKPEDFRRQIDLDAAWMSETAKGLKLDLN